LRLPREKRIAALRKFCVYGIYALAFGSLVLGLLAYLEDVGVVPTSDRSVPLFLGVLASLVLLFSLLAIESRGKNLFPGVNLPRWQLDEIAKHRRLRQKTDPNKIVWTRTFERVAVTELRNHWARVAVGVDGKFAFFVYSKDSGGIACSWYDYDTEQQAMHAAVDYAGRERTCRRSETARQRLGVSLVHLARPTRRCYAADRAHGTNVQN
jgi:hypothetical protein